MWTVSLINKIFPEAGLQLSKRGTELSFQSKEVSISDSVPHIAMHTSGKAAWLSPAALPALLGAC